MSSEPVRKRKIAGQAITNFENALKLLREHECNNLLKCTCIM
jgi:hypothetical protein